MGYSLSTLAKLPLDTENDFYVFILGVNANWKGGILQTIYENFDNLAKEIGPNAIIAKGLNPREWTYELTTKYFGEDAQVDRFFPGILITNSHPDNFDASSLRILISLEQVEENYANTERFFNLLTDFISRKDMRFLDFAKNSINWVDEINKAIDLKPNILGFGINFNRLIDLIINKKDKVIIDDGKKPADNTRS